MKFSILIPTLNEENYLGKLLEALTKQTYKDFEVIVADGKSSDRTKEVAYKYESSLNLRFVLSDVRGPGVQRNLAAKHACADNFVFLDADTVPEKDFLKKILEYITVEHIDAAIAVNRPLGGTFLDSIIFFVYNFLFLGVLWRWFNLGTGGMIYAKKSVFWELGGFDETITVGEDTNFIERLHEGSFNTCVWKDVRVPFSMRRWHKEGSLVMVFKYICLWFCYVFRGPTTCSKRIRYGFGGYMEVEDR